MNDGCHAVNRKHPDGGSAHQFQFPAVEGVKAGPDDFQTPAKYAATHKIFHMLSMCVFHEIIPDLKREEMETKGKFPGNRSCKI